jgi:hypothetical protein
MGVEIGQTFGRWTVVSHGEYVPRRGMMWLCRCQCGAIRCLRADNLKAGTTKSCRCYQRDLVAAMNRLRSPDGDSVSQRERISDRRERLPRPADSDYEQATRAD